MSDSTSECVRAVAKRPSVFILLAFIFIAQSASATSVCPGPAGPFDDQVQQAIETIAQQGGVLDKNSGKGFAIYPIIPPNVPSIQTYFSSLVSLLTNAGLNAKRSIASPLQTIWVWRAGDSKTEVYWVLTSSYVTGKPYSRAVWGWTQCPMPPSVPEPNNGFSSICTAVHPGKTSNTADAQCYNGTATNTTSTPPTITEPSVQTKPASNISSVGATLHATVNPNFNNTSVWFEYGTSTDSLGFRSTRSYLPAITFLTNIATPIYSLLPSTTYYYRVVAQSPNDLTPGDVLSFRTLAPGVGGGTGGGGGGGTDGGTGGVGGETGTGSGGGEAGGVFSGAAPSARTTPATNIFKTSITLNGIVVPNGAPTTAWFEYGKTRSLSEISDKQNIGSSFSPTKVKAGLVNIELGTEYYYRIVAKNAYGLTRGSILSTTALASPGFMISSANRSIYVGDTATFKASYDPDGGGPQSPVDVTEKAIWKSSNPTVALMGEKGQFMGSFAGGSLITAVYNGKNATFGLDDPDNLLDQALLIVSQPGTTLVVKTDEATNVLGTAATLNGSINTNGSQADVWFEYGPSEFLGEVTETQHLNGGTDEVPVSRTLTALQPNTTYYYRAAAQNALGIVYGSTAIFTTPRAGGVLGAFIIIFIILLAIGGVAYGAIRFWRKRTGLA